LFVSAVNLPFVEPHRLNLISNNNIFLKSGNINSLFLAVVHCGCAVRETAELTA